MNERKANRNEYLKTSRDFFSRKKESIKLNPIENTNYMTLVNNMKLDIKHMESTIRKYSDVLTIYKADSNPLNMVFHKKCVEVSNKRSDDFRLDRNIDELYKYFNCVTKDDLLQRLSVDFYLNDMFISKLNDIAFIINVKQFNENNAFVDYYKENLSKYNNLRYLFESHFCEVPMFSRSISQISIEDASINFEDDLGKVLKMNNINELFEFKTEDQVIMHIKSLLNKFYDKTLFIFNDLLKDYSSRYNLNLKIFKKTDDIIGNIFSLRQNLEKILNNVYTTENAKYEEIKKENIELQKNLEDVIKKQEIVKELIQKINEQTELTQKSLEDIKQQNLENLYSEINTLTRENLNLKNELHAIKEELKIYKSKYNDLNSSFDNLMVDMFDKMKKAFLQKIETLTSDFTKEKNENRKNIQKLSQECNIAKQMKEMFMNQSLSLKRVIS
jgi:hypothetical protein